MVEGQQPAGVRSTAGEELVVDLLTVGPGPEVWERWGHNTIIITDRLHGTSTSYNWGLFDFQQENFLVRFVQGRMWYAMGGHTSDREIALYRRRDRSMRVQQLNLPPAARRALRDSLVANDTDARRNYFYDYYRDNCSTRVRDALDVALGGALRRQFVAAPSGRTWRWETRRITAPDLLLYLGIMIGEGRPVEEFMSRWEQMFLPIRLEEAVREVTLRDSAGSERPLVAGEREIHRSSRFADPVEPRTTWPWLLGAGLVGGAILAVLGAASGASRAARLCFGIMATGWSLLAGTASLVLLGLWFLTDHWVARNNENVLLLTPLSLGLAVLIPMALRVGDVRRARELARRVAMAVVVLAGAAFLLKMLPRTAQTNAELIGLLFPIHLGLRAGLVRLTGPA
jgi:hypothetical protein